MEKEAPTIFKMISESPKEMKQLTWTRLGNDTRTSVVDGLKRFFKTGDQNILK